MAEVFVWIRPGYKLVTVKLQWNVEANQVTFLKTTDGRSVPSVPRFRSFSSQETPNSKWLLEVKEKTTEILTHVSHSGLSGIKTNFVEPVLVKMSILNKKGEKVLQKMLPSQPNKNDVEFMFYKKDLIRCLQSDGSLTFCWKIFTHLKQDPAPFGQSKDDTIKCLNELSTHFGGLFNGMQFSDVNFKVCGSEFPAHKLILSTRSKVFAAIFKHPMREQSTNQIEIEDIKPEVFNQLLRFIYTGGVQFEKLSETMVVDLFIAADKYLLGQLKIKCENYLLHNMSPDICVFYLLTGDLQNPSKPLKEAVKFFRRFPNQVMATDGWKKMKQENPVYLCDIQQFVLCKK
jgi:speckle-type POZ protein